jgi:hypothetical protein
MSSKLLIAVATSLVILAGCSKGGTKPDDEAAATAGGETATEGDYSSQTGLDTGAMGEGGAYAEPGMEPGDEALVAETVIPRGPRQAIVREAGPLRPPRRARR